MIPESSLTGSDEKRSLVGSSASQSENNSKDAFDNNTTSYKSLESTRNKTISSKQPSSSSSSSSVKFIEISKAQEAGHAIAITPDGTAYSFCLPSSKSCNNELGQLGRKGDIHATLPVVIFNANGKNDPKSNTTNDNAKSKSRMAHAYAGGFANSGHSALLDANGYLHLSGCDRWQQLGLGSSHGGSSGYTWENGRLWQEEFRPNGFVVDLLKALDGNLGGGSVHDKSEDMSRRYIRDVALGGDHTVVLSSNRKDVITFGKGGEGQLGLTTKPWVSAPMRSKALSSKTSDIAAVCAFRNCSLTLDERGNVKGTAGKCSMNLKGIRRGLEYCVKRAREGGLIQE
ncbi:hypothetical protein ACHAXS_003285 [Conticribra weissflogii]